MYTYCLIYRDANSNNPWIIWMEATTDSETPPASLYVGQPSIPWFEWKTVRYAVEDVTPAE